MTSDSSAAQTAIPPLRTNPALQPLAFLVGDWEMTLTNASFLPPDTAPVKSSVSFAWIQDGALLAMSMGSKQSGTPTALWLLGRDEATPDYTVLYYDERQVSRVYAMSFAGGVWKMWRDAPGFRQRFEGTVSETATLITARWEKSLDGATWEHDFDVTYTRVIHSR